MIWSFDSVANLRLFGRRSKFASNRFGHSEDLFEWNIKGRRLQKNDKLGLKENFLLIWYFKSDLFTGEIKQWKSVHKPNSV